MAQQLLKQIDKLILRETLVKEVVKETASFYKEYNFPIPYKSIERCVDRHMDLIPLLEKHPNYHKQKKEI